MLRKALESCKESERQVEPTETRTDVRDGAAAFAPAVSTAVMARRCASLRFDRLTRRMSPTKKIG